MDCSLPGKCQPVSDDIHEGLRSFLNDPAKLNDQFPDLVYSQKNLPSSSRRGIQRRSGVAAICDPMHRRLIESLGLSRDARVLEVGAAIFPFR